MLSPFDLTTSTNVTGKLIAAWEPYLGLGHGWLEHHEASTVVAAIRGKLNQAKRMHGTTPMQEGNLFDMLAMLVVPYYEELRSGLELCSSQPIAHQVTMWTQALDIATAGCR